MKIDEYQVKEINGKGHADAPKNKEYFDSYIERPLIWEKIRKIERYQQRLEDKWLIKNGSQALERRVPFYSFTGINRRADGTYQELTAIMFHWKDSQGRRFGYPLSLHQWHSDFKKELEAFL